MKGRSQNLPPAQVFGTLFQKWWHIRSTKAFQKGGFGEYGNHRIAAHKRQKRVYKFRAFIGDDENNKQICMYTTWKPPEGLTEAKEKKLAKAEAYRWEQQIKKGGVIQGGEYTSPLTSSIGIINEEDEKETLRYFVEKVWMPLKVVGGGLRPTTITMYQRMAFVFLERFGNKRIKEVTAVESL